MGVASTNGLQTDSLAVAPNCRALGSRLFMRVNKHIKSIHTTDQYFPVVSDFVESSIKLQRNKENCRNKTKTPKQNPYQILTLAYKKKKTKLKKKEM